MAGEKRVTDTREKRRSYKEEKITNLRCFAYAKCYAESFTLIDLFYFS